MTRSKRLGYVTTTPAGNVRVYICPPATIALVKQLHLADTNNNAAGMQAWVSPAGTSLTGYIYFNLNLPAYGVVLLDCWLVLHPGDQVFAYHGGGNGFAAIYGAELPGP